MSFGIKVKLLKSKVNGHWFWQYFTFCLGEEIKGNVELGVEQYGA